MTSDRSSELLSIGRAAKILQPAAGSYDQGLDRIWRALERGDLCPTATRKSPRHRNPQFDQRSEVDPSWFERRSADGSFVCWDGPPSEYAAEWTEFFRLGLVLPRSDVEALDDRSAFECVTDANMLDLERRSHWNVAEALAWVATQDIRAVARMGCEGAWMISKSENQYPALKLHREATERRAVGWLIGRVSVTCQCGAQADADTEIWERCTCTAAAYNRLLCALRKKASVATDKYENLAILDFPILDCRQFSLSGPASPGTIKIERAELEANFGALGSCENSGNAEASEVEVKANKRGPKLGSGLLASADIEILEKMRIKISDNPGMSANAAAGYFVNEAKGGGTPGSIQDRLRKRYTAAHPD